MCAPRTSLMGRLALGFTIYFEYGFWTSYFGRFWPKDPTSSLKPLYHFLLTLATIVLSFRLFSQPFNNLFSFPISRIYSPKLVEKIMITLMASERGGPMLLLLSGCLVGSGVWWGWHWNWFPLRGGKCPTVVSFKKLPGVWAMAFLVGDGVFRTTSRPWINGHLFQSVGLKDCRSNMVPWDLRPWPQWALSPVSHRGVKNCEPYCRGWVCGPNGHGGPVSYISPPLIRAWRPKANQGVQEAVAIREAQLVGHGQLRD